MLSGVRLIDPSGEDDQDGNRRKDRTKNRHKKHGEVHRKEIKSRRHGRERESDVKSGEEDGRRQGLDGDALRQGWEKSDEDETGRHGGVEIEKRQGEEKGANGDDKRAEREDWMTMPFAKPKSQVAVETQEEKVRRGGGGGVRCIEFVLYAFMWMLFLTIWSCTT